MGNDRLAFIGDTLSATGEKVPELFIVNLPKDEQSWKRAGDAPLQGTAETLPAPPAGREATSFDLHPSGPIRAW